MGRLSAYKYIMASASPAYNDYGVVKCDTRSSLQQEMIMADFNDGDP